jgi:hypothetical protein
MSNLEVHLNLYMFCFTEKHLFIVRLSKYSGEKSTQTCDVCAPLYLAISKNVELLQKIQDRQVSFLSWDTIVRGIAYLTEDQKT